MLSKSDFLRLTESVDWSIKRLDMVRRERFRAIRQYVGTHYSEGGADRKVPVNFLQLAIKTYQRALAARIPRALLSAKVPGMKPIAADLEIAVNLIPDEIALGKTFRRFVKEALFTMGILKMGLHSVGNLLGHNYGEIFVDLITLDDYVLDMTAKERAHIQYEGNDYWVTRDELRDSPEFSNAQIEKLSEEEEDDYVLGENGQYTAQAVGIGESSVTAFKKRIHLRDLWLPQEGLVVTYAVKSKTLVDQVEWDERAPCGPYAILGLDDVPGNLLPLAPSGLWMDLHELSNALFRKLSKQADGAKSVMAFREGDETGATNFKDAFHGDGITYTGAEPRELKTSGVDSKTLAFFLTVKELQSYYSGNIDALGGLAPQTETLGQDRLLTESASAQLRDMQGLVVEVARDVFRMLAYYEWKNPVKERTLKKPIPGLEGQVLEVPWNRSSRQGDFNAFDLEIDVYSLIDDSPNLKLQRLGLIMQQYILPFMPLIERDNGIVNVQALLNLVAKYADLPELRNLVTFPTDDPSEQQQNMRIHGAQSPGGLRQYEHVSRPATPGGASSNQSLIQQLLAGGGEA